MRDNIVYFRCVHITDIGVGYVSTMLSLTALFLRWCSQVRDFGLQHLCSMRNLQVLSLAGESAKKPFGVIWKIRILIFHRLSSTYI